MIQFMELSANAVAAEESSRIDRDMPVIMKRATVSDDSQMLRSAATAGKYKIINATFAGAGAGYNPTPAQILAAQMAEEFYGTQVTFVHADPTTFKVIVQELTGNGSQNSDQSHSCNTGTRTKPRAPNSRSRAGLQKSPTTFKQPGKKPNSRNVQLQPLQLRDPSPGLQNLVPCRAASSSMPSPVSPLSVFHEFELENCSSGDGGQGSAHTQGHDYVDFRDRGSDNEDDGHDLQVDARFTFPRLLKETATMLSPPKLLHLFPGAPDDG